MSIMTQGPGAAAQNAATAAENAQLDAQIELAAKKAALRGLNAQVEGEAAAVPAAPPPPGMSRTTIVLEKDGKTTVLENPTDAQLSQVGLGASQSPWNPFTRMQGPQIITLAGMTLTAIVAVTWVVVHYVRRGQAATVGRMPAEFSDRITRLENAIETVAVEVERVSESQRYVSRMLSEGAAAPVAGAMQGERVLRNSGEG